MKASTGVGAITVIAMLSGAAYVTLGTPSPEPSVAQEMDMPQFTADGALIRPEGWEAWVMVGASLGLTYTESGAAPVPGAGPGMYHTVFMQPWAYQHVKETGEFPENTMLILAMSQASQHADPARGGSYEGDRMLSEVHLKKQGQHESGWGFYAFGGDAESAPMIPGAASCYSCHAEQAAYDHVFTQFYPPLRRLEEDK